MRKIKLFINTGFVGAKHVEIIEVEDDTSDAILDEVVQDFLGNQIEYGWIELDEENGEEND